MPKVTRKLIDADKLKRNIKNHCAMPIWCHELVKAEIDEQPTIEAHGTWMPCSKRLPTEEEYRQCDGRFIVTDGGRVCQRHFDIYDSKKFVEYMYRNTFNTYFDDCVIAWMPLPEPYKENDDV